MGAVEISNYIHESFLPSKSSSSNKDGDENEIDLNDNDNDEKQSNDNDTTTKQLNTNIHINKLISRLYLLSDVLFNSQQPGVRNAFLYRDAVELMAPDVFESLGKHGAGGTVGRMTMNKLATAVSCVLAAWTEWSVYNPAFMDELQARFEGRELVKEEEQQ